MSVNEDFVGRVRRLMGTPAGLWGRSVWARLRRRLAGLPLGRAARAEARARLGNARAYWGAGEVGAARYELRLLCGSVR